MWRLWPKPAAQQYGVAGRGTEDLFGIGSVGGNAILRARTAIGADEASSDSIDMKFPAGSCIHHIEAQLDKGRVHKVCKEFGQSRNIIDQVISLGMCWNASTFANELRSMLDGFRLQYDPGGREVVRV